MRTVFCLPSLLIVQRNNMSPIASAQNCLADELKMAAFITLYSLVAVKTRCTKIRPANVKKAVIQAKELTTYNCVLISIINEISVKIINYLC